MSRNRIQDRPPCRARLRPEAGIVERPRLFEKGLRLRRHRDSPIQVRQRDIEIFRRASNAGRQQPRGDIVGPFCKTGLDMTAGRLDFALRKQHRGQQVIEHGLARLAHEALFAKPSRFIGLGGIKGGRRAPNDFFRSVLAHIAHIISVIASQRIARICSR